MTRAHKLKKDDKVIVIAGRNKGEVSTITKVLPNGKLIVDGVNLVKKHTRPDPNRGIQGGIVDKEAPIESSNVAIYNDKTGKADRIGFKIEDGKKYRVFKSNGENVDL